MRNARTVDIAKAAMFIALMAIGANIGFLKVGSVPLTLQTFFAILAGLLLGSRLGAFSMMGYAILGLAGLPIFAEFQGGLSVMFGPTFGFVLSFVVVAYVSGKILETKKDHQLSTFIAAALAGLVINYIIGTIYLYVALNQWVGVPITFGQAWIGMLWFFVKDFVIALIAGFISPRIYRAVNRTAIGRGYNHVA